MAKTRVMDLNNLTTEKVRDKTVPLGIPYEQNMANDINYIDFCWKKLAYEILNYLAIRTTNSSVHREKKLLKKQKLFQSSN